MRWLCTLTLLSAAVLPAAAEAKILWRGDFETGDISQYSSSQMVSKDRLQVVTSPVREGQYSLRTLVKQGDDPINASGYRNELVYFDAPAEGTEVFYRWSTLFDASFPASDRWQLFSQFHHTGCCGSPPVEFFIRNERIHLRVGGSSGEILWTTPLVRETWQDFVLQVRWSPNRSEGRVALWHQNEQVLPVTSIATSYPGERTYWKLGLYRDASIQPDGVLFHDNVMAATTLEDVMPAPVTPEPQPEPQPQPQPEPQPQPQPEPGTGEQPEPQPGTGEQPIDPPVIEAGPDAGTFVPGPGPQDSVFPPGTDGTELPAGCSAGAQGLLPLGLLGAGSLLGLRRRRRAEESPLRRK